MTSHRLGLLFASASLIAAAGASAQTAAPSGDQKGPAVPTTRPLGLTQDAWNARLRARGESRVNPGYVRYIYNPANVFPIRTRESMITTIKLPEDERLKQAFAGDDQGFQVGIATPNSIAIKALFPGVDTNLVAFTEEGRVYTFYLRSEGYNSKNISDFLVDVVTPGASAVEGGAMTSDRQMENDARRPAQAAERIRDPYASLVPDRRPDYREYAEWSDFHPGTVVEDLGVYVPQKSAGGTIPYRVFRDDRFTYVDYGPNATQMTEWPTPLMVVQGVEGPVGFRTAGPGGRMMVMEALGDFVLRNGQRMIVIKPRSEASPLPDALIEYPVASAGRMSVPSDLPPGRPLVVVSSPKTVVPTRGPVTREGEAPSTIRALPTASRLERRSSDRSPPVVARTSVVVTETRAPAPASPVRTVVAETRATTVAAAPAGEVATGAALRPVQGAETLAGYKVVTGRGTAAQLEDRWKSYRVQYYSALNGKRMAVEAMPDGTSAMSITPVATVAEGMRLCGAIGVDASNCVVKSAR